MLDAAAVGIPDKHYGQEIMACVVLREGHAAAARTSCATSASQHLGRYKTPKVFRFVERAAARAFGQGAAAEAVGHGRLSEAAPHQRTMPLLPPLPWPLIVASLLVVFAAGIVRGFSGFGFSALCVAGLSLFAPPAQVVPPIFMLEVLASISLLRGALKDADWPWLSWLVLGNALFIPLGILVLAFVPETPLRLLIGALLLLAAVLLRSGFTLALAPTRARAAGDRAGVGLRQRRGGDRRHRGRGVAEHRADGACGDARNDDHAVPVH